MTATAPEGNLRGAAVAAVAASAAAAAGYHEGTKRLPRGTAGLEELAEANTAGSEELEWSNKLPSALCVLEREASAVQEVRHAGV